MLSDASTREIDDLETRKKKKMKNHRIATHNVQSVFCSLFIIRNCEYWWITGKYCAVHLPPAGDIARCLATGEAKGTKSV